MENIENDELKAAATLKGDFRENAVCYFIRLLRALAQKAQPSAKEFLSNLDVLKLKILLRFLF